MVVKLKLNEVLLFEEKAGTSWNAAKPSLVARPCQLHRMESRACQKCLKAGQMCPAHIDAFQNCDDCRGAELPAKYLAPLAWLLRRRREPGLDWETYLADTDEDDALAELKNV